MRTYCHIVPGRLRLKLPGLKNSLDRAERCAALARQAPGVTGAAANPTTGSLLIQFDPARTGHTAILDFLREQGEIDLDLPAVPAHRPVADPRPIAEIAGWACGVLGKEMLKLLLGQVLEETPWSMLLAFV